MMSFYLFLISFFALRPYLVYGSDGYEDKSLIRYLTVESGLGHKNGPHSGYHGWRKPIGGTRGNETHHGKHNSRPVSNEVSPTTEYQTGVYETRRRRPVQQFFYNICIQNSRNIRVNNFINEGEVPNNSMPSFLRYDLTPDINADDVGNTPVTEKQLSTETMESASTECRSKGECGHGGVVLEVVNRELSSNVTEETPVGNRMIEFETVNDSSPSEGQHKDEEVREKSDGEGIGDASVGNIQRTFRPEENDYETGNTSGGITRHYQLRYPEGMENDRYGIPGYFTEIPQSASQLHANDRSGADKEEPLPMQGKLYADRGSYLPEYPKRREYPVYGRHSYQEIMRKLFEIKNRKDSPKRNSDQGKAQHTVNDEKQPNSKPEH